ncbi:MAG: hypothetical protein ACOY45_15975 [Pseudomonadota bacterium]
MKPATMRQLRQIHLYLGLFFAPAILFFAVSGALQTAELHEGGSPPGWIAWMAALHKHQTTEVRQKRPQGPPPVAGVETQRAQPAPQRPREEEKFRPLKPFTLLTSIALAALTLLGVVIALTNPATKRKSVLPLAAGVVLPALLMFF